MEILAGIKSVILLSFILWFDSPHLLIPVKSHLLVLQGWPDCLAVSTVPRARHRSRMELTIGLGSFNRQATCDMVNLIAAIPTTTSFSLVFKCSLPFLLAIGLDKLFCFLSFFSFFKNQKKGYQHSLILKYHQENQSKGLTGNSTVKRKVLSGGLLVLVNWQTTEAAVYLSGKPVVPRSGFGA